MKRKLLAMALSLAMVLTLLPMGTITANAAGEAPTLQLGTTGGITPDRATGTIYFGTKADGITPALYRVVAKDTVDKTITLLYDGATIVQNGRKYDNSNNNWYESDIRKWLNGIKGTGEAENYENEGFLPKAFTDAEKNAIAPYGTESIVLPSVEEVGNNGTWGYINDEERQLQPKSFWWLRSSGNNANFAALVYNFGFVDCYGLDVNYTYGVRPAFKLNLDSVLFTTAAEGGKSGAASADLSSAVTTNGAIKLTVKDSEHNLGTATTTNPLNEKKTITVNYTGASIGKTLSAIVVKKSDSTVTHYGKLAENISSAKGSTGVTLPAGFDSNTMALKLFTETINGDNLTDYASQPVEVTVTDTTAPTVSSVTPSGTSAAVSGNVAITFDEAMDTATAGTVTLTEGANTTALTDFAWSNDNKTVTFAYTGLANRTPYTVSISGFSDAASNKMAEDSTHRFTTGRKTKNVNLNVSNSIAGIDDPTSIGANAAKWEGSKVYMGDTLWRVLDSVAASTGTPGYAFLFSEEMLGEKKQYHNSNASITWNDCTLRKDLNGEKNAGGTDTLLGTTFKEAEKNAIAALEIKNPNNMEYNHSTGTPGGAPTTDKLFLLSLGEVRNASYGFGNDKTRAKADGKQTGYFWWLRSPGYDTDYAAIVDGSGYVYSHGFYVFVDNGVRPAFNLNLSSVLFTSASRASKSASFAATSDGGETKTWKLTLKGGTGFTASRKADETEKVPAGGTMHVNVSAIGTQDQDIAYTQLSAMLVDSAHTVVAYGKIKDKAEADSNLAVTIPSGISDGNYTMKVFAEDVNSSEDSNLTDYASNMADIEITVGAPTTYTLTIQNAGSGTSTVNGSYAKGTSINLDAGARTGYTFSGWSATGVILASPNSASTTFTMPAGEVTVTANWTQNSTGGGSSSGGGGGSERNSIGRSSDSTTGIQAEGTLYSNIIVNRLTSSKTGASNEVADEKTYNELKVSVDGGFTVLGAYEITCASYSGSITLSFPVDAKYNGQEFIVKHKTGDGKIHTYTGTVKDGKAVITVPSLSPFMLAVGSSQEKPKDEVWFNPFTDVTKQDWFYEKTALACKLGLMQGTSVTTFAPNRNTTRGMIVTVLYNMAGKPEVAANGDAWYARGSAWAMAKGISDSTNLEGEVTREQLVTMLWRNAGSPAIANGSGLLAFTDAGTISEYAKQAFSWAIQQGILQGKGNQMLDPQGKATRAEVATIMMNYLNAMKK